MAKQGIPNGSKWHKDQKDARRQLLPLIANELFEVEDLATQE